MATNKEGQRCALAGEIQQSPCGDLSPMNDTMDGHWGQGGNHVQEEGEERLRVR